MSLAEQYNEHPAAALLSVKAELDRLGVGILGILGNDAHTYGWHLSAARLIGTGHEDDRSLQAPDRPIVDERAACAIDIASDWPASGEWLEDVRRRCELGDVDQVAELIGDPDLIPGPHKDILNACYASLGTGWRWVEYNGQGHVTWAHVGIRRHAANDRTLGETLLGGWTTTGREDDYMGTIIVPATGINIPGLKPGTPVDSGWLLLALYQHVLSSEAAVVKGNAADTVRDTALQAAVDELAVGGNVVDLDALREVVNDAVDRVLPAVVAKVDDDMERLGAALNPV